MWKDIKGYEGLYQINSKGQIKHLPYQRKNILTNGTSLMKERIIRPFTENHGYQLARLYKNSKATPYLVHRLVAEAFIPNPDNLPEVNHKDENKLNNNADNLEWCSHKYNINYGSSIKKRVQTQTNRKDLSKPVICVETETIYPSIKEATRQTGINNVMIGQCCLGKQKTAGSYHWKYLNI